MAGCYVNPCSKPESKLLSLSCSGCTAPMTGEGTLTASLQQCKFLFRDIPAARLIEHSSAIYALPKYTDLPNTGSREKPAVEAAELDAVVGVYKTEEQAKRWMLALCVAGIKENALRITAGPSLLDEKSLGYVSTSSWMWSWGRLGMLIGEGWGLVFDSVLFSIPGVEPFRMAALLVSWIVAVLEGSVLLGCAGVIAGGLAALGLRRYRVTRTGIEASGFALRVHGSAAAIAAAKKAVTESEQNLLGGRATGH